jgi:hypothetical protein
LNFRGTIILLKYSICLVLDLDLSFTWYGSIVTMAKPVTNSGNIWCWWQKMDQHLFSRKNMILHINWDTF